MKVLASLLDIFLLNLVRLLVFTMQHLPPRAGMGLARGVVRVGRVLHGRADFVSMRNLQLVFPEKPAAEKQALMHGAYNVLARNLYTFAKFPSYTKKDFEAMVDYSAPLETIARMRSLSPGKGILILTLHYGNFELLGQVHAVLDRPSAVLNREFGYPRLDAWWRRRREVHGIEMFSRKGGFKEMIKRIDAGQDVAVLFDQNVKANYAAFIPLFGMLAATTKSIAYAAIRTGAQAVVCAAVEHEPGRAEILFEHIDTSTYAEGGTEERVENFLRQCHVAAEKFILKYPDQWFWLHRRFKTRPQGEPEDIYL